MNKTERKVFEYLTGMGMIVLRQFKIESCKRVKHLPFDLCIPEYKTIVEIDGAQHFKTIRNWMPHEETLQRDIFKMRQAEKEGYRVIRVFQELVFKESTEWMKEHLYDNIISEGKTHKYIADTTTLYDRHKELYDTGEKLQLIP
jgi:very-short-patch-repair endonuclease